MNATVGSQRLSFLRSVGGVVHVGANDGAERDDYAAYDLRVLWVEPIREVYDKLIRSIAPFPKQQAFCKLITDRTGVEYEFHIANNDGHSSSILEFAECRDIWPTLQYVLSRRLRSITLDELFRLHMLSVSDFPALVMDVQGAELLGDVVWERRDQRS